METEELDTHLRTLIKTMSWRLIAVTVTVVISYAWLDDFKSSLVIGIGANSLKVVVYYMHERLWNGLSWGRKPWVAQEETINSASPDTKLQSKEQPARVTG